MKNEEINDMIRTICLVQSKKSQDDVGKYDNGIIEIMNFWGNGKGLCDAYVENEREKIRKEKERIRKEKERIEKERKDREMKEADDRAK